MVKFSKQFEEHLVHEWKEAFVDYWKLRKDLKKIQFLTTDPPEKETQSISFISSLENLTFRSRHEEPHGVIHVHKRTAAAVSRSDLYETELFEQLADSDAAREFFTCLDLQLNKVNKFYKTKEKEFLHRGETLKRQIDILVELKEGKDDKFDHDRHRDDSSISDSSQEELQHGSHESIEKNENPFTVSPKPDTSGNSKREDSKLRLLSSRSFICQGKNMKINIPLTTPLRALSAIGDLVGEDLIRPSLKKWRSEGGKVQITRSRLRHAEKMIQRDLIEVYKGLGYLNTYRILNMLAFIKILKKFDKVTGEEVLPVYLKVVESSYFNSSDQVMNLSDDLEELFVHHFAGEDKRKVLLYLRPQHRKDSHGKTFFIGLFTGCFVVLLVGYVITTHIRVVFMETMYHVVSLFVLIFLHLFLYGCNIFAWRKTRINYSFLLDLSPTNELKYRDVFLICTTSMTAVVCVMFIHLSLLIKGWSVRVEQVIPGLLLLGFLVLLTCPLKICYHSTRCRFLGILRNIIFSPFYKVPMVDFFMADQLCSQVPMLRRLEYVACYYLTGSYKTEDYGYCLRTQHYRDLTYAVSFLPYYWRATQCARRWFDEGETSHLVNLGKYASAMLAAGAKVSYEKERSVVCLCAAVTMSSCATVYQLYWDFVKDWGLLQENSRNPWLRNKLMLRQKGIYYLSMGLNLVLRLAWLESVLRYSIGGGDDRVVMELFVAAMEVMRRGLWNFFRLENEHLHNAGKFRAVKTVPLPFHEVNQD